MTMDQMRSRLKHDGLNYSAYRNQIRKENDCLQCATAGSSPYHRFAAS